MPVPSSITDISTTAASNSPAGSDTIGTSLDDYLRAIQAIMRVESLEKEWVSYTHTPTRTGNTAFTIPTDVTAIYTVGRRIKCTDSSTIYGTITASSYGAPNTTVTISSDTGNLSASLTAVAVGASKATSNAIPYLMRRGAAVASATTPALDTVNGEYIHITGTTTITGFTLADGQRRTLVFDDALTFTHNATSLILPTGANITTAAGDTAIIVSEGSNNVRCVAYVRKDGTPVGGASYKVGSFSRDISTATGTQGVTGVGFKPKAVILLAGVANQGYYSVGFGDGSGNISLESNSDGSTPAAHNVNTGAAIILRLTAANSATATVSSLDADGFTVSWTKNNSPIGSATIGYLAFR